MIVVLVEMEFVDGGGSCDGCSSDNFGEGDKNDVVMEIVVEIMKVVLSGGDGGAL